MSSEAEIERLAELVAAAMRNSRRRVSEGQIVKSIKRRNGVTTDTRSVRLILTEHPDRFAWTRRRFLQIGTRWRLVEAGPSEDPGNAGAPVPARPYRPLVSGAAAVPLTFREDEPPTDAIGRTT